MPPSAVRTIRDVIYWQYAKLIAKSAGFTVKESYGFSMSRFKKLQSGEMTWSTTVREWEREHDNPNVCVYCGMATSIESDRAEVGEGLTTEHLLPKCCGGPDTINNVIKVCKSCNSKKGGKRLYEWFVEENRDKVPRIAEGKYLKLLYELHEQNGTLEVDKDDLTAVMCPKCALKGKCVAEGHPDKLTVYCLEGVFK